MTDAASFDAIIQYNLLEVFCEALGAAIFVTDRHDEITFASIRLLNLFPLRQDAITPGGRARDLFAAFYDAGCRFGATQSAREASKSREEWISERIAISWKERVDTIEQTGNDRWFHVFSRRFSSGLGFTILQDISEHKRKENQWRIDQERVRLTEEILDNLPVAVSVKDRNLNYAAVNKEYCRLHKVTADSILGRSIWDIIEPTTAAKLEERNWAILASGEDLVDHLHMQGTNGESFETLCKVRRIGKPGQHYLVACMDEILPPQGAALLGDLKIPINSAGESPTSPVVETAAFHTAVPLSSESHSCSKVVIASSKSVPAEILSGMGEKHECEICLLNSVAELAAFLPAVKEAGITIDFVLVDYALGPAALTIVSKESLNYRIIPPDWKPETAIDFLFKRPVMSEPDLQTAHTESMPFLGQPNPDKPGKSREDRVKILAIEDNPINGMALGQILESLGVAHSIVTTGIEALARLREGTFDLVLCDMTLPDMEPHILVQAIIDAGSGRRLPLPVVGMTSGDRDDQRQACLDCGMAEGVAKPLSPEIIDSIIRQNVLPPTPRSTQAA